jgi:hypothetical protein
LCFFRLASKGFRDALLRLSGEFFSGESLRDPCGKLLHKFFFRRGKELFARAKIEARDGNEAGFAKIMARAKVGFPSKLPVRRVAAPIGEARKINGQ